MKRIYPKQPIVGVGAIIISKGKILLEKRKNEPGKGKWSVPGGLVELGESTEHAVIREVKEETGLEVDEPELMDVVDNVDCDDRGEIEYHFVIIDYIVKLKSGSARAASDAEELKWVTLEDVERHDLTKTFREFFRTNHEKLRALNSNP